jgi:hypothetical protein
MNVETEGYSKQPQWWTEEHTSGWERVKTAFRRDWEQTKADFSSKHGAELGQNAADTVKQAVGAEPAVPPAKIGDWNKAEPAARFGYGARSFYKGKDYDSIESSLEKDWGAINQDAKWADVRDDVRAGWDYSGREIH